jgi:hypothetical protein
MEDFADLNLDSTAKKVKDDFQVSSRAGVGVGENESKVEMIGGDSLALTTRDLR